MIVYRQMRVAIFGVEDEEDTKKRRMKYKMKFNDNWDLMWG